jgi:hypothetical protein
MIKFPRSGSILNGLGSKFNTSGINIQRWKITPRVNFQLVSKYFVTPDPHPPGILMAMTTGDPVYLISNKAHGGCDWSAEDAYSSTWCGNWVGSPFLYLPFGLWLPFTHIWHIHVYHKSRHFANRSWTSMFAKKDLVGNQMDTKTKTHIHCYILYKLLLLEIDNITICIWIL